MYCLEHALFIAPAEPERQRKLRSCRRDTGLVSRDTGLVRRDRGLVSSGSGLVRVGGLGGIEFALRSELLCLSLLTRGFVSRGRGSVSRGRGLVSLFGSAGAMKRACSRQYTQRFS